MDATAVKTAQSAADRRLIEYFLIISTLEKDVSKSKKHKNKNSSKNNSATSNNSSNNGNNGDMTFTDWRTESSGYIHPNDTTTTTTTSPAPNGSTSSSNTNGGDDNVHDYYNSHIQLQPKITARYPLIDHYDHPLQDENVIFFCHPSGSISLRTQPHMPKVPFVFFLNLCD
jgi:hypothetical protein